MKKILDIIGFKIENSLVDQMYNANTAAVVSNMVRGLVFVPVYREEGDDALYTPLPDVVEAARTFAATSHTNTYGKGDNSYQYEYHLDHVLGEYLSVGGNNEHQMVALYLHDAVEDTNVTMKDIGNFCDDNMLNAQVVIRTVDAMTDIPHPNIPNKGIYNGSKLLDSESGWQGKLCDRLANCRQGIRETGAPRNKYIQQQADWLLNLYRTRRVGTTDMITFELQSRLMELLNG